MNSSSPITNSSSISYNRGHFLLIILCLFFLGFFYGKILTHPNQYLFNSHADGIKNYYAYAYYIQNNHSNTSFEGLNYPYGEVVIYTDCNPAIAFCIRGLTTIFPQVANYSIGILNWLMIFSFLLTAIFLYLIFKNLRIHPVLSALGAFSITVLAPQIFRMTGHYSLSFSYVIPLTILLLIKIEQGKRIFIYAIIMFLHIISMFFNHPYLGLIPVTILLAYLFIKWIFLIRQRSFYNTQTLLLALSAILPLSVFYIFIKIIDTHVGRSTNPYGFFDYYADIDTIFLPNHPPFQFLVKNFLPSFTQTWEGWNYIGIVGIGACLIVTFLFLKNVFKKKRLNYSILKFQDRIVLTLFIASLPVVFFSMGLPFRFLPKDFLNHFAFIKQFRSVGRFAWVFFFVINLVAIYGINLYSKKLMNSGKRFFVYSLFVVFPMIIFFEGMSYHFEVSKAIVQSKNLFQKNNLPGDMKEIIGKVNPTSYQAIIPIPYYNFGSENYMKETSNEVYVSSMLFSYYTKLPLVSNFNARSSIWESKKLMQLFGNGFYNKEIEKDFDSNLPFLLLYIVGEGMNLHEDELYRKGKLVYENDSYVLLEVEKTELFKKTGDTEFTKFNSVKGQLSSYHGFLTNDTSSFIFYKNYDNEVNGSMINFRGKGTLEFMKNDRLILAEIPGNKFPENGLYIASFWIYNDGVNYGQDVLNNLDFSICQIIDEHERVLFTTQPKSSMVINNNWSLVELVFRVEKRYGKIQFILQGKDWKNRMMYLDDLFIYRMDSVSRVYYRVDTSEDGVVNELFKNNHRIRR
jgi:hypothetical protein